SQVTGMHKKNLHFQDVLYIQFLWIAQAPCQITQAQVERTTRVFMQLINNQYTLKRIATSPMNEVLRMWCSRATFRDTTCRRAGAQPSFNPPLPMNCTIAPAATVSPTTDSQCTRPYTMYRVGYSVSSQRFAELYRVCYHPGQVRARFVTHRVYAKPFMPRRPCVDQFTGDGVLTRADEGSFFTRSIYATFQRLFGFRQQYIPNNTTVVINRGHLAASGDFLFRDQMCATFKLINVAPMFKNINDGNWARIENFVRSLVTGSQYVNVRTGTRDVLTLPSPSGPKAVTLSGNNNPVPMWLYKRVWSSQNRALHAFVTYNNEFTRGPPAIPSFCRPIRCPNNIAFVRSARAGYSLCCDPNNFNP
ncbi:hypothetical protein KR018_004730, partial [Drosophila ironensis]